MGAMRQPAAAEKSLYSFRVVSVRFAARGEVTERPMVLAWKAGVVKATRGSNPRLSAIFLLMDGKRLFALLSLLHINGF